MTPPRRWSRLISTGNVVIDLVVAVARLPERGGDLLADSATYYTGGAFNVMAAAARLGLPTVYAGVLGTGPRAERARADLEGEAIAVIGQPAATDDTGLVVCLVEPDGERTFVTVRGAEATLTAAALRAVTVEPSDVVHVSGYSLAFAANRTALLPWLRALNPAVAVLFDPGPLISDLPPDAVSQVLARADWLTCNAAEARQLTNAGQLQDAVAELRKLAPRADVIVRAGADGAWLAERNRPAVLAAAPRVRPADTTGAGDAHTGALLAALAEGVPPLDAVRLANVAAAVAVTRRGPATGPTRADLVATEVTEFRTASPPRRDSCGAPGPATR
jgi:sugar/nucleoside kinase (ribokinase family)